MKLKRLHYGFIAGGSAIVIVIIVLAVSLSSKRGGGAVPDSPHSVDVQTDILADTPAANGIQEQAYQEQPATSPPVQEGSPAETAPAAPATQGAAASTEGSPESLPAAPQDVSGGALSREAVFGHAIYDHFPYFTVLLVKTVEFILQIFIAPALFYLKGGRVNTSAIVSGVFWVILMLVGAALFLVKYILHGFSIYAIVLAIYGIITWRCLVGNAYILFYTFKCLTVFIIAPVYVYGHMSTVSFVFYTLGWIILLPFMYGVVTLQRSLPNLLKELVPLMQVPPEIAPNYEKGKPAKDRDIPMWHIKKHLKRHPAARWLVVIGYGILWVLSSAALSLVYDHKDDSAAAAPVTSPPAL